MFRNFIKFNFGHTKLYLMLFLPIFILALFLFSKNLSNKDITLWDEAVHINVVKNLANNCCTPVLHYQNFNLDFRGWDNNYIWLHKPLLPFYINALFYRIFNESVLAFRLIGLISAITIVIALYAIGKKFFHPLAGLCAALVFATMPFVNSLVHELQFSGFVDLSFMAVLIWSLYFLFAINSNPSKKNYLLFALFAGLAFLFKSGLVYGSFLALIVLSFRLGIKKTFISVLYAALLTLLIIAPQFFILSQIFPTQFAYEQSQYLEHFNKALEYWGRPWDYYLSYYFTQVSGKMLAGAFWLAFFYSIFKAKFDNRFLILAVWIASYLIPLSFQASKIPNFIFPILPALCLLLPALIMEMFKNKNYRLLFGTSTAVILFYLSLRYNAFGIKTLTGLENSIYERFSALWIFAIIFLILCVLYGLIAKMKITKQLNIILMVLALGIACLSNVKTSLKTVQAKALDSAIQEKIRQSAVSLQGKLPKNSILLTNTGLMQNDHLYFMYWTGFDSLEIRQYQPIHFLNEIVPLSEPLYVISDVKILAKKYQPVLTYEFSVPFGYVYKIR